MDNFNNLNSNKIEDKKFINPYDAWVKKTLKEHVNNNSLDLADRAIDEIIFCEYALKDGNIEDVEEALKRVRLFGNKYEDLENNLIEKRDSYDYNNKTS